jgi:sugar lactone lactonase YvrE
MSIRTLNEFTVLADGLDHPEGIAWGRDGCFYAGGEAGQIYRITPGGTITQLASTAGSLLGVCLDGRNNVYACDFKRQAVMRIDGRGEVATFSDGAPDRKMVQPNYALFDPAGNLFVSDSGGWHEDNGCLFRIAPGGQTCVASDRVTAFPNGMALHPDGHALYVVLSNLPSVVKLPLADDGSVGAPQPVVEMPGVVPDGIAFDREANLYISCYAPDLVYRLSVDGQLEVFAQDEERTMLSSPTNLAFGGPDLATLAVANYGCWHVLQTKAAVPGCELHYPLIP